MTDTQTQENAKLTLDDQARAKFESLIEQVEDSTVESALIKAELISELPVASDAKFNELKNNFKAYGLTSLPWVNNWKALVDDDEEGFRLSARQNNQLKKLKAERLAWCASEQGDAKIRSMIAGKTCTKFTIKVDRNKPNGQNRKYDVSFVD